jgi:hypothetical protein
MSQDSVSAPWNFSSVIAVSGQAPQFWQARRSDPTRSAGATYMRIRAHHLGLALLAVLYWQSQALAALGGDVGSLSTDRESVQGQLQSTPMRQYVLHQITASSGTLIREYETLQGRIFAVSWRGPMPPDLQQLFGSYYDQFQAAAAASAQAHPGMHRQISISQPDFMMQALGRLRSVHGKAFVPSLVPAGVSVAELQ